MCGIAGQFGKSDAGFAEAAARGLRHRGPDSQAVWRGEGVVLAHTRLAIIDLAESGNQPMLWDGAGGVSNAPQVVDGAAVAVDAGAKAALVFNGEIYNFKELREGLLRAGERFHGESDTEVLFRILLREGEAALPKLRGMFAFAFWDGVKRAGLLARDALGIKPLYFRRDGAALEFASESKILAREGDEPDAEGVRDYFLWGSFQEPATARRAVRMLPAGHVLRWGTGGVVQAKWSKVDFRSTNRVEGGHAVFARECLQQSVAKHLRSDVPVGIFLSGGLDSTALLALARQILGSGAAIRTYSIGFDDAGADESPIAKRTAEFFKTEHTEWVVTAQDAAGEVAGFLRSVDQPTIDGFNVWCVCKLARRHGTKVALSGQGGDELFGGYPSFKTIPGLRAMRSALGPLRVAAAGALGLAGGESKWKRLAAFFGGNGEWLEAFHCRRGIFTEPDAELLAEFFSGEKPGAFDWTGGPQEGHASEIVAFHETKRYLRNQLLRDSDVFSMAHGLELRVPFVDAVLLSELNGVPSAVRYRPHKNLLIDAVPEIPDWLKHNRKQGFAFPFEKWMRQGFGGLLQNACGGVPVRTTTWYQTWAVAMLAIAMGRAKGAE